ncbi:MAG TPA: peptide ABC transporter substrate-binding protein, partial [Patescibacteria group bacterium]|nr:peptide ABC transporter substrate-binding protein [Patescibacteria group bacterium]
AASYCKNIAAGARAIKNLRLSLIGKAFSFMGKREKIVLGVLALAALGSLSWSAINFYYAHTMLVPSDGGIYSEGMVGQPTYINPLLAHQDIDLALTKLVFSGLYKYDGSGKLVPDLADGQPSISDDQKQYTISLKRSVAWHNGKPFTADDVIFTIQTLQDPAYKSPLRSSWLSTTVEKIDDYQVKFTTKDVSGPFVHNLTLPIIEKSMWEGVAPQNFVLSTANLQAVGTGPYVVREIKKLPSGKIQEIRLDSFSNYYAGKPKIDTVIAKFYDTDDDLLNAFHTKEILGLGFDTLDKNLYIDAARGDVSVLNWMLPSYQVAFFNLNNKILSDAAVRLALAQATDRQAIIRDVFKNNAVEPVSPLLFNDAGSARPSEFDLEAAKKTLDGDGWTLDTKLNLRTKKGATLELTIATNDYLLNSKAAEDLANQWRQLNIKVNLNIVPTKQLTDNLLRPRTFDVLVFPQKFDADPDLFIFWHSSQVKDPGLNLTGFNSADADRLITQARTTTDQSARMDLYRQLSQSILAQHPAVFLDQTMYLYALDSRIRNVNIGTLYDPSQRFYDLPNWYMAEKRVWKK